MGNVSERTNSRLALSNNLAHAYAELSPPIRFAELSLHLLYFFLAKVHTCSAVIGRAFHSEQGIPTGA